MSTWHQALNKVAIMDLWRPHPIKWKCVHDKFNQPASCMLFDNEADAEAYSLSTGAVTIAPQRQTLQDRK